MNRVLTSKAATQNSLIIRIMSGRLPEIHATVKLDRTTFEIKRTIAPYQKEYPDQVNLVNNAARLLASDITKFMQVYKS